MSTALEPSGTTSTGVRRVLRRPDLVAGVALFCGCLVLRLVAHALVPGVGGAGVLLVAVAAVIAVSTWWAVSRFSKASALGVAVPAAVLVALHEVSLQAGVPVLLGAAVAVALARRSGRARS